MNEGPDFQPLADDDAHDPLLGALRQRLGENFGQEPPPALWASIRPQLPAAAPRPWWLRGRRLLVLLALVGAVLLSGVAGWLTRTQPAARRLTYSPAAQPASISPRASGAASASATTAAVARPPVTGLPVPPAHSSASNQGLTAAQAPRAAAHLPALPATGQAANASAPGNSEKPLPAVAATRPTERAARGAALAAQRQRRRRQTHRSASALTLAATAGRRPTTAPAASPELKQPVGSQPTAVGAAASATAGQVASGAAAPMAPQATGLAVIHPARRTPRHSATPLGRQSARAGAAEATETTLAVAPERRPRRAAGKLAGPGRDSLPEPSQSASSGPAVATAPPAAPDSLAGRRARLQLAALALPAPLAARPDSAGPWLPPVRRWSVLVLAGPTISYRTTGQLFATSKSSAPLPPTVATNSSGYAAGSTFAPSLVGLERPAAGLGAQVQVRRVLTGRWALALGAGYQEYATRLALQVSTYKLNSTATGIDSTTTSVHQRDTYRLLTLPVQLSYALGPPRGRLSLGLLAGLEPSLYVGGRTTEGSSCSCQQQVFTSASGSPYSALSLGLSLGLDARYRLGGAGGRWQLVMQPTGRYVVSPFVRSSGLGYAQRQPYSLGLLTGFSWDLR